jgi:hypothetical protein
MNSRWPSYSTLARLRPRVFGPVTRVHWAASGQVLQILRNLGEAGANQGFVRPEPIIVLILSCALRTAGNQASRLVLGQ